MGGSGLDPAALTLEITEGHGHGIPRRAREVHESRGAGRGAGHRRLRHRLLVAGLSKRFPVDVLKIDRSFVDGLGSDPDDTAIVQAIMVLASSLGLSVTAEGVETEVQLSELVRLGCRRVQGYLFGRPMSAERLWELVDRRSPT